jgi:uridine kinase
MQDFTWLDGGIEGDNACNSHSGGEDTGRTPRLSARKSLLVAVSGIDASGKSFLTELIVAALQAKGVNAAGICADGWLSLPSRRFSLVRPAEHFYRHAFRFREMFGQLVLPLKEKRSIRMAAGLVEETAAAYHRHTYNFRNVDVIVLEGIFLLKRVLRRHYDSTLWIDCPFETALERALQRGQEGLRPEQTIRAYETIYFPAQRIHFALDRPVPAASLVLNNDGRILSRKAAATPRSGSLLLAPRAAGA